MATLTASLAASTRPPKRLHAGANLVTAKYVTAGNEGGDEIHMLRVPDGAVIHDMVLSYPNNLGAGGSSVSPSVGDQNDPARFISTATTTAAATLTRLDVPGGAGYKYDFSDDVSEVNRLDRVLVNMGGTTSSSVTITLSVLYSVDD